MIKIELAPSILDTKVLLDEIFDKYDLGTINRIEYLLKCKAVLNEVITAEKEKAIMTIKAIEDSCNDDYYYDE